MKKAIVFIFILTLAVALSACNLKKPLMDKLAEDNNYHYKNADLGFSLTLPPEFIYYQTQRKKIDNFTELAIFVPTSDTKYPQEVASYAKPLTIEVYKKSDWNNLSEEEKGRFTKSEEKNDRVYGLVVWPTVPDDWKGKWSDEMKNKILDGFKTE